MPLFILLVGIILVAAGINNKIPDLITLLKEDFKPSGGETPFQLWILAIAAVGAIGYVKPLKGFANGFLVLVMIGLILSNGGFADKLTQALKGEYNG